jgi:transcriptional regulator with XRE-family HTH domain
MDDNKAIGLRIFNARKLKKMSRVELGKLVNLHETTVKRYEDGEIKSVDIEKLKDFAIALELSPVDLLGWEDKPTQEEKAKEFLNFEDYLNSLGYEVKVNSIPSKGKFLVEAKDTTGNVIGKTWVPSKETAEYTLIKNNIVSTFTQDEFDKLQQTNAQMLDAEIYKNSLKTYVNETLAAHRSDDPTKPIEDSALENSVQRLKDQALKKHGIKYK